MQPLLGAHGIDLVGGNAVGQHRIEIERGAKRQDARRIARDAHGGTCSPAKIMSREPALTCRPSIIPCSPEPMDSRTCSGTLRLKPRAAPASTIAWART